MAKVKFKVSVKEINFEYEGDFEQGRVIQQGISQTLGNLANLQQRAMGLSDTNGNGQPKMIESRPVETPIRRRRRRRSAMPVNPAELGTLAELANGEVNGDSQADDGEDQHVRDTGTSPTSLIVALRKDNFFIERRTMGEVLTELHRRGYSNIKRTDISGKLGLLVRKQVLNRDKVNKQWAYTNGAKDEA